MRILLVDDSPEYLELCRMLLPASQGYVTYSCPDAITAWWHISDPSSNYDLAIIDLNMPGASGLDLVRRIRADARLHNLPVILCTGVADRQTVLAAFGSGITLYIAKPFRPSTLLEKIASAASHAQPPLQQPPPRHLQHA